MFKIRSSKYGAMALALTLLFLVACGGGDDASQGAEEATSPAAQPYKIGVIMPLSGSLAAYGESTLLGVKLKVEEINAAGGIKGRKIQLVIENNEGNPTKSMEALLKLAGLNKALVIIGPITSTNALAIVREAQRKEVVLITPTATNDAVTGYGDFIFRACFTDSFQGRADADFAWRDLGIKKVVAFQDTKSDYSVGLCRVFMEKFAELGGTVMPVMSYATGDTDFTAQLRKIRKSGAEAIFAPGYPPELPLIVNLVRNLKLDVTLLGSDGWDNNDLVVNSGRNLDGSYFSTFFSPDRPTPEVENFMTLLQARGVENPGAFEAMGYDSVGLIGEALANAEGPGETGLKAYRRAIRDSLASIQDYQAVTGVINMRASGDPDRGLIMLKYAYKEGKITKTFVKMVSP